MNFRKATIITGDPIVVPLAEMKIRHEGILEMAKWVEKYRPECMPEKGFKEMFDLLPHEGFDKVMSFEVGGEKYTTPAFDGSNATGAEREVTDNELLAEFAGRKCFDGITEVLTETGWVPFSMLPRGRAVATLNAVKDMIEFQLPTDYIQKKHVGPMYTIESRSFSIRVTPDHDMWAKTAGGWKFAEAGSLLGTTYGIRRAAFYEGTSVLDVPGFMRGSDDRRMMAWARFLGHYIAEGSLVDGKKYGVGSRVVIYQKAENAGPILENLAVLGYEPYLKTDPRNGVLHIVLNNTELANHLMEFGALSHMKRLPLEVFTWPAGMRAELLDGLMFGDGTVTKGARVYTTTSKQLASDVQTLITLSGKPGSIVVSEHALDGRYKTSFASNHPIYLVREGKQIVSTINTHGEQHDTLTEAGEEMVYCVTVPNRILLLRRNGKVFMASNCYDSFGEAGRQRTNGEYLRSMWEGRIPHRSTGYHAKFTFFFAEVSRRVSHELIRNYVGADRDEEGCPSQESTRFTHHPGIYIAHPAILNDEDEMSRFTARCNDNYAEYQETIARKVKKFTDKNGAEPKGLDKKRIYESTAGDLLMECGTSWIWTTNPMAALKFFQERDDEAADLEMCRFARAFKREALMLWPNLFPTLVKSV